MATILQKPMVALPAAFSVAAGSGHGQARNYRAADRTGIAPRGGFIGEANVLAPLFLFRSTEHRHKVPGRPVERVRKVE